MRLTKTIVTAIAAGSLSLAGLAPAFADGPRNDRGHRNGYSSSNHHGYSGQRGGSSSHHGHNRHDDKRHYGHRGSSYSNHNYNRYNQNRYYQPRQHYGHARPYYGNSRPYYNQVRPRFVWNPRQPVIYAPRFTSYYPNYSTYRPRYNVGYHMRLSNHHRIYDYSRYGLYQPPPGHYWVRSDGDAYLAAAGTGIVAGIIIGALLAD